MKRISKGFLASLRPRDDIYEVRASNLMVIIRPSGRITFYVYTTAGGTRKKYKIASFPDNKLDDAQINAVSIEYRRIYSNIHLPSGFRPEDLERQSLEAYKKDLAKMHKENSIKLSHLLDKFMELHGSKKKSGYQDEGIMRSKFEHLLDCPIRRLDKKAIIDTLHGITSDTSHNNARATIRLLINWGVTNGFQVDPSIVKGLPLRKTKARQRMISDVEIKKLWSGMPDIHRFLLITGQRRMDAVNMDWSHLDSKTRVWTQPDSKTGNPHSIKLPEAVIECLPDPTDHDAVFIGPRGGRIHMQYVTKLFKQLSESVGINDLVTHDLRKCALTNMAGLGDITVAERIANHALPGVQSRYYLSDRLNETEELIGKWHQRLMEIVE